jgi:hypothetical protein
MAEANVTTDSSAPKALDVPTTDVNDLVKPNTEGYYEQEDWRPEPLYQYGTLDTSDTAGAAHQSVAEVSPVFQEARARTLVTAARALDPEDDGVGEEMVTLPTGSVTVTGSVRTADEARRDIEIGIRKAAENPVIYGGPTEQQRKAAEEDEDADDRKAESETAFQGGSTATTATTAESTGQRSRAATSAAGHRTADKKN